MSPFACPVSLAACLLLAAVPGVAAGRIIVPGQPWHERADMEKALAEAAFKGLARTHPGVGVAYGAYSVVEAGRKVTDERVTEESLEAARDLLVIDAEAARLRTLVDAGRFGDPEARALVARMEQRAKSLPGGTGRFVVRALADRRTLYVATRNYARGKILSGIGKRVSRWLGVRQATPVLRVSLKGVKGRFQRAQWKAIRHIARRFDLLAERVAEKLVTVLVGEVIGIVIDERIDEQIDRAAEDFKARNPSNEVTYGASDQFRLRVVEAAPLYVPVAAVALQPTIVAAEPIVLRRSEDPVIDYASVQSQVVQHYDVEVHETTVPVDWPVYEDRSSDIPDLDLPDGNVDWDGVGF